MLLNCINIEFYLYMRAQGKTMSSHPAGKQLLELKYALKGMRRLDEDFSGALGVLQHLLACGEEEATAMAARSGYDECVLRGELPGEEEEDSEEGGGEGQSEDEGDDDEGNFEDDEDDEAEDSEYDSDEAYRQDEEQYNSVGGARGVGKGRGRASDIGDIGEYADLGISANAKDAKRAAIEAALRALSEPTKGAAKGGARSDDCLDDISGKPGRKSKAPLPTSAADSDDFDSDDVSDEYDTFEKGYTSKHKNGVDYTEGDDGYDDHDFAADGHDSDPYLADRKRRRAPDSMDADGDMEASVFAQFSKKKREFDSKKKEHYAVPARYGGAEDSLPAGQKRAASYEIMKNRGLTPHRKKSNRNPRVKKREKYAKAIVARKGQVRDVVVGGGAAYGGEMTGIKSNLARSRKIYN